MNTLTHGSIPRQLIRLALPLLLGNLIQQFYNTADMMIVGRAAGAVPFAAIGVAGSVMHLFTYLLMGFTLGCSILFANRFGAEDFSSLRRTFFTTGVILAGLTLTLTALGLCFLRPLLALIHTPAELLEDCARYLTWIFLGLIFTALYNLCATLLQALGRTQITLLALAAAMCVNISLDLLFVARFHLGSMGAALATVLAQLISALVCLFYLLHAFPQLRLTRKDLVFQRELFLQAGQYGSASALQQSSLYLGKLLVQSAINAMGAEVVTAFTAACCLENLILAFGDSGAAALAVFVAQNDGAHCDSRMAQGLKQGRRLMAGVGIALGALLFLGRGQAMALLLSMEHTQVLGAASNYLGVMCVLYLLSFLGNTNQGYFRGSGHINCAFCATMVQILIRVLLTYLLPQQWGLLTVAAATGLGWVAMLVTQHLLYRRAMTTTPAGRLKTA